MIDPLATPNLRINGARLWESLGAMAEIGPGLRGGNNRQTLTEADRDGRLLFQRWCEAAGMSVAVDSMGNMFARRAGQEDGLAPVLVGSHLDTQPTGGRYDGVLGTLAALELVRSLNELGIATRRPIEVVNWTNEEGARFAPSMTGSGVFAGVYAQDWAYALQDAEGVRFGDALEAIGFRGAEPVGERRFHAFFELHIEQGPVLEAEERDIGVVTHGQGLRWLEVTFTGREAHTGTTPMDRRRDAGLAAARVVAAVNDIAKAQGPLAMGACGQISFSPNSRNIVPGEAVFTIDFRHPEKTVIDAMEAELRAAGAREAEALGLEMGVAEVGAFDPVTFDPDCVDAVRRAAERLGYRHRDMISGAGHDACWINRVAPTAMIFCPCEDGLSHNEDEAITPAWAEAGANVLLHAALEAAEIVPSETVG